MPSRVRFFGRFSHLESRDRKFDNQIRSILLNADDR
jgi:hypothetical protein